MPAVVPPHFIVSTVDRWAPGFWPSFIRGLQAARGESPALTSWYRDPVSNAQVGGSRDSQHLAGAAVDVVDTPAGMAQLRPTLQAAGFVVVPFATHLHVQAWPASVARRSGLLSAIGA